MGWEPCLWSRAQFCICHCCLIPSLFICLSCMIIIMSVSFPFEQESSILKATQSSGNRKVPFSKTSFANVKNKLSLGFTSSSAVYVQHVLMGWSNVCFLFLLMCLRVRIWAWSNFFVVCLCFYVGPYSINKFNSVLSIHLCNLQNNTLKLLFLESTWDTNSKVFFTS